MASLALGLDYGTGSCRALVVDTESGEELATAVYAYPTGTDGVILDSRDPHLARQDPRDYLDGFRSVVQEVGGQVDLTQVVGIGVDTTGSSPMPVTADNRALAEDILGRHTAMVWLWKDHTAHSEAAEITALAQKRGEPYLDKCGGTYSSEWFWSKLLKCLRTDPEVFESAASWMEICDWIPATLCGVSHPGQVKRSRCAAGHKAMFEEAWGGLPSEAFLAELDPRLAALRGRLYSQVFTSDETAGFLSEHIAAATGLPVGIPVAVGAFDAHFGAVGSGAKPGTLVKIIGTSTCDCIVHPEAQALPDIPGVCGIVRGSVLPGCYGIEAGQSAVGDIFNWVVNLTGRSHQELTEGAKRLLPGQSGLVGLDWHNGNRTVLVDPLLSGMFVGLGLHTAHAEIYRAAIEATAFGARRIIERLEEHGVKIERVVACGGIADKSRLVMQVYADVLGRPVSVAQSEQACAVGATIFGAVVGGAHADAEAAQEKMASPAGRVFQPEARAKAVYDDLYGLYLALHDQFGLGTGQNLGTVMKRLIEIRERANG